MRYWTYIVLCADRSYYTGTHRGTDIEDRIGSHNNGTFRGYTYFRRPVKLVWAQEFQSIKEAIEYERRIKGWTRAKKKALIKGNIAELKRLSNSSNPSSSSG